MVEKHTEDVEDFNETLETVGEKLSMMLAGPPIGRRSQVDCVGYCATDSTTGEQFYPQCLNPEKNGDEVASGCELVETLVNGKAVRKRGITCGYQIKRGSKGAAELSRRIDEITGPKF